MTDPPAIPTGVIDAAARAAHRSQFVDPAVEHIVWTSATSAYRQRWHTIAAAALTADRPAHEPGS